MKQPNVLFVISDQHNAKVMGHAGHPDALTPNMDRLAGEGVCFSNAITQSPICSPSRTCYLSGQYCHNHGFYSAGGGPDPGGLPNLLGHFREAGYFTIATGKHHTPLNWVPRSCDRSIGSHEGLYTEYLKGRGLLRLNDSGRYPEDDSEIGKISQSCDGRPSSLEHEDSLDGWIARRSLECMEEGLASGKPFMAMVNLHKPHQIYAPPRRFWDLYDQDKLTLPPNVEYDMGFKAPHLREQARFWREAEWPLFEPKTFQAARRRKYHGYLGCVSQVDYCLGQMLDWLDEKGLTDDTIVIYATDHGDYACEHGIMEKAPGICSDAITRIPFIWRWPGRFQAGHNPPEIVETVDLSATLCRLAGLPPMRSGDGKDISHLLSGGSGEVHRVGVTEFLWSKSIRRGNYRYVYYPREMFREEYPDGFGELYDLEADPWEMENLYFKSEYVGRISEMKDELLEWLAVTAHPRTMQGYDDEMQGDGRMPPVDISRVTRQGQGLVNPCLSYL